jgi:hypothetical protein
MAFLSVSCGPKASARYVPVFLSGPRYAPNDGYDIHGSGGWLTGTVGVPFDSDVMQADCFDGAAENASWGAATTTMNSGELPPGLTLSPEGVISGVPTLAGDWNFTLLLSGVTCGGPYRDVVVQVRIVTTGD